ncbi:hypothetical protein EGJ52_24050 [Pseudomonas luteola]|uniref:hypothetical protein n=2 Tax=Pseudomonas TaxID=286 RepID=UPI000F7710C0|nr:hypothetical protein [Pseudomonas luteola]RRW39671.1 hypothetical protein EGJ52_24050 [Pseudomonas luteola]
MLTIKPLAAAILIVISFQAFAEMNSAEIQQVGTNNTGSLEQQGSGNYAYLQQDSQENSQAEIFQNGTSNSASVYQLQGSDNNADITQQGDSNNAAIRISENGSGSIFGSGVSSYQEGNANTLDITVTSYAAAVTTSSVGDN